MRVELHVSRVQIPVVPVKGAIAQWIEQCFPKSCRRRYLAKIVRFKESGYEISGEWRRNYMNS